MAKLSKSAQVAAEFANRCESLGWTSKAGGCVVTIYKSFTPGSNDEFVTADGEYFGLLSMLPMTQPGSVWGTDGGGVGAIAAIKSGRMRMNKSGVSKRIVSALAKIHN